MAYKLTPRAEADLFQVYVNGSASFGQVQAEDYAAGLKRVFEFLASYPRAARERSEVDPPVRAHPYKSHLVIYVLRGKDVLIVRIRHGHEDWMNGLF